MTYIDAERPPGRFAWREQLGERAALHGWRVAMLGADWGPDMVLVRRPNLVWVFAEPDRGRLSTARFAALVELRECRQEAFVWHPNEVEKIERILR